jgi:hypothetical protein
MKLNLSGRRIVRQAGSVAILVLAVAGCNEEIYQIDLLPKGDKIERRLTISRAERELADPERSEVERIAKLYGVKAPALPAKSVSFTGTFANTLPRDVGGDGHFVHVESPLGRVDVYVERFRGNDDLQLSLEARRKAVDQLVDLLVGWFESELRDAPDWPVLRSFLDKTFRNDLQNLSLYAWALNIRSVMDSKNLSAEISFRAAQYFVERGYLSYEEAPVLVRVFNDAFHRGDATDLLTRIRRLLIARSGSTGNGRLADALGFLSDRQHVRASWRRYFEQTGEFKQQREKLQRQNAEHQEKQSERLGGSTKFNSEEAKRESAAPARENFDAVEDAALTDLQNSAFPILNLRLFGEIDTTKVSLVAPREPFWTNGKWDAKDRRVVWSQMIAPRPDSGDPLIWELPMVCVAAWDEPNEEAQSRLLGAVGVTQSSLLDYCLWYQGLTGLEKREWDAFIPTVKKDASLRKRLGDFQFSNEPAGHQGNERIAFPGANTILNTLESHKS